MTFLLLLKIIPLAVVVATIVSWYVRWKLKDISNKKENRKNLLEDSRRTLNKTKIFGIATQDSLSIFITLGKKLAPYFKRHQIKQWKKLTKEIQDFAQSGYLMFNDPISQFEESEYINGQKTFTIAEHIRRRPEIFQNLSSNCYDFLSEVVSQLYKNWKII
jgi:hypothetical protein